MEKVKGKVRKLSKSEMKERVSKDEFKVYEKINEHIQAEQKN